MVIQIDFFIQLFFSLSFIIHFPFFLRLPCSLPFSFFHLSLLFSLSLSLSLSSTINLSLSVFLKTINSLFISNSKIVKLTTWISLVKLKQLYSRFSFQNKHSIHTITHKLIYQSTSSFPLPLLLHPLPPTIFAQSFLHQNIPFSNSLFLVETVFYTQFLITIKPVVIIFNLPVNIKDLQFTIHFITNTFNCTSVYRCDNI